jgi:hypothetical protein
LAFARFRSLHKSPTRQDGSCKAGNSPDHCQFPALQRIADRVGAWLMERFYSNYNWDWLRWER